ncbi:MAG: VWA domain-containing protein [Campylobacterota bacterium]|nr:VWA domain-containing protein [Campylobacterota bacterium]
MLDDFLTISFEYPYVFLLFFLFIFCAKFCKAKVESFYMPHLEIYSKSSSINSNIITLLKWVTIITAIIALASPIKELNIVNNKKDGIDMILSLDTSGSMRQIGFNRDNLQQNRWVVVQELVKDFISKRLNDNIGLVVFGSSVMTASPLSYDKKAQNKIMDSLDIGIVGDKTALINSIATSINILKNRDSKSKIIIALTDGDDTASTIPLNIVLKMAKKYNIKIYTIAIGTANNYTLNELSNKSKGRSFVALSKTDLKDIYNYIDMLEKSKIDQNKIVLKEYYYFYPLFISFLSLLFFIYLKNKRESL